jgi:hypothetical protein
MDQYRREGLLQLAASLLFVGGSAWLAFQRDPRLGIAVGVIGIALIASIRIYVSNRKRVSHE